MRLTVAALLRIPYIESHVRLANRIEVEAEKNGKQRAAPAGH